MESKNVVVSKDVFSSLVANNLKVVSQTKELKAKLLLLTQKLNNTKDEISKVKTEGNTDSATQSSLLLFLDSIVSDVNILINII